MARTQEWERAVAKMMFPATRLGMLMAISFSDMTAVPGFAFFFFSLGFFFCISFSLGMFIPSPLSGILIAVGKKKKVMPVAFPRSIIFHTIYNASYGGYFAVFLFSFPFLGRPIGSS